MPDDGLRVKRPGSSKDPSTQVAEGLSKVLSGIEDVVRENNPIGFGQEELSAKQYRQRILAMSKQERMDEMETRGIDVFMEALGEE